MADRPGKETARPRARRARAGAIALALAACAVRCGGAVSYEEIVAEMGPYRGRSERGVDTSTLAGKLMCGYQGWFAAPGDGSGRGWVHYGRRGRFDPEHCTIDLWPDVGEMDPDEKYATAFRRADGSVAHVFSSFNRKTVLRHFRWMREYGVDGAFVQRFATSVFRERTASLGHRNTVLAHCREGANLAGRAYAVMYDLSGLKEGQTRRVMEDWRLLRDRMRITQDPAYLRHDGRPVVAVWGVGFKGGREYTLDECAQVVRFLKGDPRYGRCTVMLGVPTYWRTLERDCLADPRVHEIVRSADIVSPWTVGRYRTPDGAARYARETLAGDVEWCRRKGLELLPVAFPGFSWHNLKPEAPLGQIPRLRGRFLWAQYVACRRAGATMVYQAMFDEVDEGTAIFKCTDDPPVGPCSFLTYEGLPADHYLWLAGRGAALFRGELAADHAMPRRKR